MRRIAIVLLAALALLSGWRCGMIAARLSFHRRAYTAKAYVQKGLIALWDGIENNGWGSHTTSAKWVDCVGGKTLTPWSSGSSNFKWYADHVWFKAYMRNATVSVDTSAGFTVEAVAKPVGIVMGALSDTSVAVRVHNAGYLGGGCLGAGIAGQWQMSGDVALGKRWYAIRTRSIVAVRAAGDGSVMRFSHSDGQDVVAHPLYPSAGDKAISIGTGAGADINTIYRLAVYDRPLTAKEIKHNHMVDRKRFGLPS